ncbi:MAG: hypothetical protein K6T94_10665 [Paenibacillus sp.]|nr:hypothetical protein [Paenibacillus sp.]
MKTMRDSWFMIRRELSGDKVSLVLTFLFSILFLSYLGFFTGILVNESLGEQERNPFVDFILLTILPILGFTYSRRSFKYLSEDSYTKMLIYLQSLPIPAEVILCKRKIQSLLSYTSNGIVYFGLMYLVYENLRIEISPLPYIVFALTWIGYGFIITGIYIFIEFLFSGKMYFGLTLLIMALSGGIAALVYLAGGNLLVYSISYSKDYGFQSPLMWGTIIAGTVSIQLFSTWTINRLKKRNLV